MDSIITIGFLLIFVAPTALYLWISHRIMMGLELQHAGLWNELGRPRIRAVSFGAMLRFIRFCWSSASARLGEGKFRRLVVSWRFLLIWLCLGYFALLAALVFEGVAGA